MFFFFFPRGSRGLSCFSRCASKIRDGKLHLRSTAVNSNSRPLKVTAPDPCMNPPLPYLHKNARWYHIHAAPAINLKPTCEKSSDERESRKRDPRYPEQWALMCSAALADSREFLFLEAIATVYIIFRAYSRSSWRENKRASAARICRRRMWSCACSSSPASLQIALHRRQLFLAAPPPVMAVRPNPMTYGSSRCKRFLSCLEQPAVLWCERERERERSSTSTSVCVSFCFFACDISYFIISKWQRLFMKTRQKKYFLT